MSNITTTHIPGINFDSGALSRDSLQTWFDTVSSYATRSLGFCSDSGVVSETQISTRTGSEYIPLWLEPVESSTYRLLPGVAVTSSGDLCVLETATLISLPTLSVGVSVVGLRHVYKGAGPKTLSSSNTMIDPITVPVTEIVTMSETAYLGLDDEYRSHIVIVAGVQTVADSTGFVSSLLTEPTTSRTWLRPWFSFRDAKHRSMVGSGTVTDSNPHGTGFADILTGKLGFYEQLTTSGMLLSKPLSVAGIPGFVCFDDFSGSSIKLDGTGYETSASFFGGTGVWYVELSQVPNTITSVVNTTTGNAVGADLIPGTRILVLYLQSRPESLRVSYTRTPSAALVNVTSSSLVFGSIAESDILISNGTTVPALMQTGFSVRNMSVIPRFVRVFCDNDGFLLSDPTVVSPAFKVSDKSGSNLLVRDFVPGTSTYIGLGLTGPGTQDWTVTMTVSGVLDDGSTASESITITPAVFEDNLFPPTTSESDKQVHFTRTAFASVSGIVVSADSKILASTTGLVYARYEPSKQSYAELASFFWNGREMKSVVDARRILPVVRDGRYGDNSITASAEALVASNEILTTTTTPEFKHLSLICAEDFSEPQYLDVDSVQWSGRGRLDPFVIPPEVTDSSLYRRCYRSRMLPLRKYDAELCGFVVVLHGVQNAGIQRGCVRVMLCNEGDDFAEAVLVPMKSDLSGRLWIGYTQSNFRSAGFVISGLCSGYAAYFTNAIDIDTAYLVDALPRN